MQAYAILFSDFFCKLLTNTEFFDDCAVTLDLFASIFPHQTSKNAGRFAYVKKK